MSPVVITLSMAVYKMAFALSIQQRRIMYSVANLTEINKIDCYAGKLRVIKILSGAIKIVNFERQMWHIFEVIIR